VTVLELQTVKLEIDGALATIVLNRPKALNAWTRALGEDMLAALERACAEPGVRVIAFTGAGRAFSSGADLKSGAELGADGKLDVLGQLRDAYNPLLARVRSLDMPVIAKVNGPAVGIGCSLALACDLVVAAESAYFLLAFVNIGLGLDGGASLTVSLRAGHARAFEMALLGERIPAEQALQWGLVNRVVPDGELDGAVFELAARLAAASPGALATIKRTINHRLLAGFEEVLELEAVLQQERVRSADFLEALTSFLQGRPARFDHGQGDSVSTP
jgi:2-(1,2-epoxy-1,2-dihydrophenyl)acetyl-CoA isomerase